MILLKVLLYMTLTTQSQYRCPCTAGNVQGQSTKAPVPGRGLSTSNAGMWCGVVFLLFCDFFSPLPWKRQYSPVGSPLKADGGCSHCSPQHPENKCFGNTPKMLPWQSLLWEGKTLLANRIDRLPEYPPSSHFMSFFKIEKKMSNSLPNQWRFIQVTWHPGIHLNPTQHAFSL